ncbi:MAG: glycoside hydrolase family 30 beta sandwich domain-containing protein [Capnocytophaga sp.]|nr:glycoside hydrolase family 30 beta sandwich domain-containing protein [Capnocytophaga sp.]
MVTAGDRSKEFFRENIPLDKMPDNVLADIELLPGQKYQSVYGFGSAITGSSCYNLMQMNASDRAVFLKETFSPSEGLGQNYLRISIGCSDFSMSEYTLCDTPGIENFALQEEELEYVIPILKEILTVNPDVKILGSPWTPPRWMKVNTLTDLKPHNEWTSGHLNPKYYQDYAVYFVKWIQAMKNNGIDIEAVTPQNEPLNRGNSASLFMGWDEQRDFVKVLGRTFKNEGISTKIYLFDHNYNYDNMPEQQQYPLKIYEDSEVAGCVAGAAYHNYGGHHDELDKIHQARPDKELIFTETSIGTWNDGRNLEHRLVEDMEYLAFGTLNNWSKAVIVWNLMLDQDGAPNREHGCKTCYGAVDIQTSDYKTITRNSHYYVIGHLSASIQPGAVRIGNQIHSNKNIDCSTFENPDGSYAVIVLNKSGKEEEISIKSAGKYIAYTLPKRSVGSFLIKK